MAVHHYVPGHILKRFASGRAGELVNAGGAARRRIAARDEVVITNQKTSGLPLCVYNKDTGLFSRRELGSTCSAERFYELQHCPDPLLRGMIGYAMTGVRGERVPDPQSTDDFLKYSDRLEDAEGVERLTAEIDGAVAEIFRHIREGDLPGRGDLDVLRRFVVFSVIRTPAWRRIRAPKLARSVVETIGKGASPHYGLVKGELSKWGLKFEALVEEIEKYVYCFGVTMFVKHSRHPLAEVPSNIDVIEAPGTISFVTCDNPARPYVPTRLKDILYGEANRFNGKGVVSTLPIDPQLCLRVNVGHAFRSSRHEVVDEQEVRRMNTAKLYSAEREVVLPSPDEDMFEPGVELRKARTKPVDT